ncbi:Outer membrane receptor proteins, mostly Fe transport [Chryseobacterium oleae]|uniref:Outer membrane receptor proteins, mostly Fe transport n=1 Tax=Chryseobacterium oleae TaxID=491207 RepID=A0A1I4XGP1_CHROL|nr:outer membrane beta-barrel family protein [Chryseobacterium oleae]SFN24653.1 Outer membrane receptor proteins, mostly Fe transport [Chryseobacterium oleae]
MQLKAKPHFYISVFFFAGIFSYGQSINGKISDQTKKNIPYAEVIVSKDKIKKTAISDENGIFDIRLPENGNYLVEILQNGRKTYNGNVSINGDVSETFTIRTGQDHEIGEISLTSKKKLIERKVDRLVFNVENSITALGGDAVDALKITPGVRLQGGDILLAGKSTVRVMVNDKVVQLTGEELQNYLKSIPSANIQKIEVITNPPAKYDAEGNSGLINIQLKEVKFDNLSATLRSTYQQATYASASHGLGVSYKKNKFSVLADLSYYYGKSLYTNDINYWYPEEHWKNRITSKNKYTLLGTLLDAKYQLSDQSEVGFQYAGNFTDISTDENSENRSYNSLQNQIKDYSSNGVSESKPENHSLNLNYSQKLGKDGKKFSVDFDYFNARSPKDNNFTSSLLDFVSNGADRQYAVNNSSQKIDNYSVKTDFDLPYKWADISFGAKASFTTTDNQVQADFYNQADNSVLSSQYDHFQYTENTQAVYLSLSKSFGEKWEAKAGLRGENTQNKSNSISTAQITERNYFKLFPTAYLSYKIDKDNTVSVNFGRRIQRPGFWEMNPAKWYQTPKSYTEGNPFLQPSFVYNLELNYSYKSLLNLNLYYGISKDKFSQLTFHDTANDIQIFRRLNYADGKYMGGTATVSYSPFSWWESSTDVSVSYRELTPYIDILQSKYSGWGGYTSTNNAFILNKAKTWSASLLYTYNYPAVAGYGTSSANSTLDIGFKYLAFEKKLTIGLAFEDILKKNIEKNQNNSSDIRQTFNQYYDTRLFRLSLSYRFGNNKISVEQSRTGNQEEKNRSN